MNEDSHGSPADRAGTAGRVANVRADIAQGVPGITATCNTKHLRSGEHRAMQSGLIPQEPHLRDARRGISKITLCRRSFLRALVARRTWIYFCLRGRHSDPRGAKLTLTTSTSVSGLLLTVRSRDKRILSPSIPKKLRFAR